MTTVLRPMTTGEILDRTFNMYRRNFWLFVGIAALPPALMLVVGLLMVGITSANLATATPSSAASAAVVVAGIGMFLGSIAYLIGWAIAQGATVFAVSAVHLGRSTTIRDSYARVKGKYGRLLNIIITIFIRVGGTMILCFLVPMLLTLVPLAVKGSSPAAGVFYGIVMGIAVLIGMIAAVAFSLYLFAIYSLAVPSCVLEDLKARAALKRSRFLAKGSIRKILAIYQLVVVLNVGISGGILFPLQFAQLAVKAAMWHIVLAVIYQMAAFVVGAVVGPLAGIALALVYYDERVRKEAYDIQLMMEAVAGGQSVPVLAPAPPAPPPEVLTNTVGEPLP